MVGELDETPEFSSHVLDALRQPLEAGHVVIARSAGVVRFPARFLMVLAANPCPCGRFSQADEVCECPPSAIRRYQARLSGPLLDRVDLRVEVDRVTRSQLAGDGPRGDPTATVADRVRAARERAAERLAGTPWRSNSEVPGRELRSRWRAAPGALEEAERSLERGVLTAPRTRPGPARRLDRRGPRRPRQTRGAGRRPGTATAHRSAAARCPWPWEH
ncbi:hypothetical protein STENM36S_02853 [Streptomyces tendae]